MELTDEQWVQVRDVAEKKAMQLTHGDIPVSEDLASIVVVRLLGHEGEIEDGRLLAYVRTMTQNLFFDRYRKQHAAYRGGPSMKHPMDEEIHWITEEIAGVFKFELHSSSPSRKLIRQERERERAAAYMEILESLPEKKQKMVRMAAEGASYKEIAQELGYANAAVAKTTLHRIYADIREQFEHRFGSLI
jgi:RNA polymerase sigma factor (sigma-70 family)